MSFINTLVEKALSEPPEPPTFDIFITRALDSLPPKSSLDTVSLGARNGAEEALKLLLRKKDDLELPKLGKFGLLTVLTYLAVGKTKEAACLYLKKVETCASLDQAVERLRGVGGLTARYALPALLGAL